MHVAFRYIQLEQKLILILWDQGLFQIPKLTMYVFGCLRHRFGFGPDLSIFSFNSIHLVKKLTKSNQSDPNIFLISPKDIFVVKTILSDLGSKIQIFDRRNQWYKLKKKKKKIWKGQITSRGSRDIFSYFQNKLFSFKIQLDNCRWWDFPRSRCKIWNVDSQLIGSAPDLNCRCPPYRFQPLNYSFYLSF